MSYHKLLIESVVMVKYLSWRVCKMNQIVQFHLKV